MSLIYFFSGDPPVDLMLDSQKIFRFLILLAIIITGSAGALVGLMVTLLRVGKIKAGMLGFGIGLLVLAGVLLTMLMYADVPWYDHGAVFLMFFVLMIMFPVGLALTGMTASAMAGKFASIR